MGTRRNSAHIRWRHRVVLALPVILLLSPLAQERLLLFQRLRKLRPGQDIRKLRNETIRKEIARLAKGEHRTKPVIDDNDNNNNWVNTQTRCTAQTLKSQIHNHNQQIKKCHIAYHCFFVQPDAYKYTLTLLLFMNLDQPWCTSTLDSCTAAATAAAAAAATTAAAITAAATAKHHSRTESESKRSQPI